MSSVPPNMPPGGAPPPYDPKTQWRIYREQQRAAWRAQRDAWRAQRHAWKASYAGPYGPRVPSVVGPVILVCIGVIALLVVTGHINAGSFWKWYGQWWPLLLIGAGLALLGEWALDMRRNTPVRRSSGFIGILVLLAVLGGIAAAYNHLGGPWNNHFGDNGFFNFFDMPEHDFDQPAVNQTIPANASIEIQNPRGDVSITAVDQPNLEVQAHEIAYANSDSEAKKIFDAEAAQVTVTGTSVMIQSANNSKGKVNLVITVPRTAKVTVNAGKGDVTAAGLTTGIDVTAPGDIHLNSMAGQVTAHFVNGRHDEFSAHDIQGDLVLNGDLNDLTISQVKGSVTQNGALLGDVHLENVSGPVRLHTSVTTIELANLDGDLNLDSDDLRIVEAKGPVRVTTRSKDIGLSQIAGDTYVEDRNGTINIEPAGSYGVEARNDKGDIELALPPNASATIDGRTHNGDIITDYALTVSGDQDKTVTGKIGSGTARIVLSTDNGDLHIKRGSAAPPTPPTPSTPPSSHKGPRLKSAEPIPPQPVTQ
jgi:DUF4097 and DUF4098 domain-containing protein YvlB